MIKPLSHQKDAIKAVTTVLSKKDRTHMVMACGTGKTVTSLWIAERMKPKSIVVFVPSLALINQFMKEWIAHTGWDDYKTLAVCSDDSVTSQLESESILLEPIDFPVSDDEKQIKNFITTKSKSTKIIFCTYQSSYLLKGLTIDFGLFDEAHKTAGYGKELFSFALHDSNVKIKKRLFMTATPRHASVKIKPGRDEGKPVFSMDDESIYGERAYTLGFREAINLDLICDYKVIISIADTYENVNASHDANAKALREAIEKSNATKIITYHKTINDAKDFSKTKINSQYKQLYISGAIPINERHIIMQSFRDSKKSIICNSKCLTEGIDVPAIDMVSFLSPKSSKIDIVQAIGRALRKSPGKKIGYIFLPVYIDSSIKDEESAIADSDFAHIWDVLNALSEQDADLNDVIREIARGAGERGSYDYRKLGEFLDFDSKNNIKFINSINAKILDKVSCSWDVWYGKLMAYKKKYGNTNVSQKNEKYKTLGKWVSYQREFFNKNILSSDRIERLNRIGFIWDIAEDHWNHMFNLLKDHYNKKNHIKLSVKSKCVDHRILSTWYYAQKRNYHTNNKLLPHRKKLLLSIGCNFGEKNKIHGPFFERLNELIEYGKKTGDINIKYRDNNRVLARWLYKNRSCALRNKLSQEKIEAMEKAGIILDRQRYEWDKEYKRCIYHFEQKTLEKTHKDWVSFQIYKYKKGKLSKEKHNKIQYLLNKGFNTNIRRNKSVDKRFLVSIENLKKFKEKHGHFNCESTYDINLYNFIIRTKKKKLTGMITKEEKQLLNQIGFK